MDPAGGSKADQGRERLPAGVLNAAHAGICRYGLVTISEKSIAERVYIDSMEYSAKELSEALEKITLPCL